MAQMMGLIVLSSWCMRVVSSPTGFGRFTPYMLQMREHHVQRERAYDPLFMLDKVRILRD